MTLTLNERIILKNQYQILAELDPENKDHYEKTIEVLRYGYEQAYRWYLLGYMSEETVSVSTSTEVLDILTMYENIEDAYKSLEDKSGISTHLTKFLGFSGNDESDHFAFATFLHSEEKFTYLNWDHKGNSHFPMLPKYRNMLSRWRDKGFPSSFKRLGKQDLIDITGSE